MDFIHIVAIISEQNGEVWPVDWIGIGPTINVAIQAFKKFY